MTNQSGGNGDRSNNERPGQQVNNASSQPDFFEQLQQKEAREGKEARGKGHGWTTFLETLLGDW
ncbi:MAG: hypothetical protein AAF974_11660 [Cyanobacteria bacterium P01_E01_bin.34]